jgi:hypothetical protein
MTSLTSSPCAYLERGEGLHQQQYRCSTPPGLTGSITHRRLQPTLRDMSSLLMQLSQGRLIRQQSLQQAAYLERGGRPLLLLLPRRQHLPPAPVRVTCPSPRPSRQSESSRVNRPSRQSESCRGKPLRPGQGRPVGVRPTRTPAGGRRPGRLEQQAWRGLGRIEGEHRPREEARQEAPRRAAMLLVHCCSTACALLQYCLYTAAILLLCTAAILLVHCCNTACALLQYCLCTAAILLVHCCNTACALLQYCLCTAAILLVHFDAALLQYCGQDRLGRCAGPRAAAGGPGGYERSSGSGLCLREYCK